MSREAMLRELRIARAPEEAAPVRSPVPWRAFGLVGLAAAIAAAGAWFALAQPLTPRVRVLTVEPAASGAPPMAGSLLDASGYVVARRKATVASKVTGRVAEVLIEEGQHVSSGQIIARLDSSNAEAANAEAEQEAAVAEAALRTAQASATAAQTKERRYASLRSSGYLSEQAFADIQDASQVAVGAAATAQAQVSAARSRVEVARRALEDTIIRAPFAGVVTVKAAQPGEIVSPVSAGGGFTRTGIGAIVDMDSLEVDVDVAESFINRVRDHMGVDVRLNAYPDWRIPAEVIAVVPTADRSKATVSVRIGLKVSDPRIVPEMGAKVAFLADVPAALAKGQPAAPGGVAVPDGALLGRQGRQAYVFVYDRQRIEKRLVRLGPATPKGRVVESGLRDGDQIVVNPAPRLRSGDRVRVIGRAGS